METVAVHCIYDAYYSLFILTTHREKKEEKEQQQQPHDVLLNK